MLSPNTILQDRYRIVRLLGKGGMGAVYEAIDQRVSCVVALKETLVGSNSEWRRAFEREAGLLANLRHPALPKVTDYFSEGESEFLVMEFIPGYDLAELLELRGSPFSQHQVLQWGDQLLNVLEYLHNRHPPILHRDVKPANLKLTRQGEIFLLDFGLAKGAAGQMSTLKASKSLRGFTPKYAPIEQFHGRTDPTSDLFSLAAALYHLLTDTMPADAPTREAAIDEGEQDPLQLIEELNPQVSPRIAAVIYQAMAMNRRHRPVSAADMKRAFGLAKEEDERFAAEEEYRRVEVRQLKQQQDTVNEDRLFREAHVSGHKPAVPLRSAADQRKFEQGRSSRRAEEEPHDVIAPASKHQKVPETIPAPPSHTGERSRKSRSVLPSSEAPEPAITTVRSVAQETERRNETSSTLFATSQAIGGGVLRLVRARWVIVTAIAIVAIVAFGVIVRLMWTRSPDPTMTVNGPQPSKATDLLKSANKATQPSPPEGMVYVPGGTFMMGRDDGDEYERPAHAVTVKPFFIDTYEVTNEDYAKFVTATSRKPPANWKSRTYPESAARRPVTWVTWDDAVAYAEWAGKRLPAEEEWEFAARGTDGRTYPWGNDWPKGLANANGVSMGTADTGSYVGKSPYGVFDMIGNAWEWSASKLSAYPGGQLSKQKPGDLRVIRGGSYTESKDEATTTYRRGYPSLGNFDYGNTGFRCATDVAGSDK